MSKQDDTLHSEDVQTLHNMGYAQELSRRIESVNHDSLKQAANRLLQGRPTFAVIGPHTGLPDVKRLKTDFVPL
jgi:predicted Zn-dependent peptidase